jgi:chorismate synthase
MGIKAKEMNFDHAKKNYRKNEINCPDLEAAEKMEKKILEIKSQGETAGGVIELRIRGVPAGLGEPVFDKLQATLSHALMSIGAIKAIEFGAGFKVANMKGSECNDHPYLEGKKVRFRTNNAGGILGGISNGEEILIRLAVKPTPTVSVPQPSINMKQMKEETLSPITRRDPTLLGRIYAVAEAMAACAILDALYMYRGYDNVCGIKNPWRPLKNPDGN